MLPRLRGHSGVCCFNPSFVEIGNPYQTKPIMAWRFLISQFQCFIMNKFLGATLGWMALNLGAIAQGPPITLDKPIMLGEKKATVRLMSRYADLAVWDYGALLIEGDYNFTNRIAAGLEVPLTYRTFDRALGIGDIAPMVKYQFYRKDGLGKTVRIAAKAKHTFPTGPSLQTPMLGMGQNMSYFGLLAAREALHLGIQAEAGYHFAWENDHMNQWGYKFGIGLPLLKPVYPVKQVNLYFEWEGLNPKKQGGDSQYGYYYSQGIQYARLKNTFEAAVQFPLAQELPHLPTLQRNLLVLVGARRVL